MTSHEPHQVTADEVAPNLVDYETERATFTWSRPDRARRAPRRWPASTSPTRRSTATHDGRADHVALRWLGKDGSRRDLTYRDLAAATSRWANALDTLGVGAGETVFTLLGRVPDLYVTVIGALKHRNVVSPCSRCSVPSRSVSGSSSATAGCSSPPRPCTAARIAAMRDELPELAHVVIVGDDAAPDGALRFDDLLAAASDTYTIPPTDPEDHSLLHFTSGTTGTPKGAIHVHGAVVAHLATGAIRARPPPRRRLLVHRRPRMGHRHVLRDHRPPGARGDQHRRRGRLRRGPLVRHPRTERQRLVHRAHRHPHADAGGSRGPAARDLSRCASWPASASRSTPRRWSGARTSVGRSTTTGGRPRPAGS
jgi:hypothetical protein